MKLKTKEEFIQMLRDQGAPEYTRTHFNKEYHYIGSKEFVPQFYSLSLSRWVLGDALVQKKLKFREDLISCNNVPFRCNLDNGKMSFYQFGHWIDTSFPFYGNTELVTDRNDFKEAVEEYVNENMEFIVGTINDEIEYMESSIKSCESYIMKIKQEIMDYTERKNKFEELKKEIQKHGPDIDI